LKKQLNCDIIQWKLYNPHHYGKSKKEFGGAYGRVGGTRNAHSFDGKYHGKRPLGNPRRKRKDITLQHDWLVGMWSVAIWNGQSTMPQDREEWPALVKTVMKLRVL
jgi:hypothetical protein